MYNWDETKELFVGEFQNDEDFWEYYFTNEVDIAAKQFKLDCYATKWHMVSY